MEAGGFNNAEKAKQRDAVEHDPVVFGDPLNLLKLVRARHVPRRSTLGHFVYSMTPRKLNISTALPFTPTRRGFHGTHLSPPLLVVSASWVTANDLAPVLN
jgi:hypothetical protein